MSGRGFSAAEKPQQCDLCGKVAELRPYGPNGECICFPCGQKDIRTTRMKMGEKLFGVDKETQARMADALAAKKGEKR